MFGNGHRGPVYITCVTSRSTGSAILRITIVHDLPWTILPTVFNFHLAGVFPHHFPPTFFTFFENPT